MGMTENQQSTWQVLMPLQMTSNIYEANSLENGVKSIVSSALEIWESEMAIP